MATVKLVAEDDAHPVVRRVFADIKATKGIDRVPNIWRALAVHPENLALCWTRLKAIMRPGKVDMLTKEIVALAVSATNRQRQKETQNPSGNRHLRRSTVYIYTRKM